MALPNPSLIQTALQNLYSAFTDDKTERGQRTAVNHLNWLTGTLNFLYGVPTNFAIDGGDAGVSEFIGGGGQGEALSVGDVYRCTGTTDFGGGEELTAKGSALAAGDVFVISGADAIVYLGNNSGVVFDNQGETIKDFVAIS